MGFKLMPRKKSSKQVVIDAVMRSEIFIPKKLVKPEPRDLEIRYGR